MLLTCIVVLCGSPAPHVIHFLLILLLQAHHDHYNHHQHDDKDHNCGHDCRHHTVLDRTLKLTSVPVVRPVVTYDTPAEGNVTLFTDRYMLAQWVRHWTL